jgi:alkylation response protein AidB-like acyl-CoA dehydrogenase
MDFQLTALQEELRETTRKLCAGRLPIAAARAAGGRVDRAGWGELDAAGVFSLRIAEDHGGLGLGMTDAAVVFDELGRGLVPGPLVWTHIAAGLDLGGASVVGGLERPVPGAPVVVEHLGDLDALLVIDADGVWALDPHALAARPLQPFDPLTPVWEVDSLPRGDAVATAEQSARLSAEGAVLTAAQLAGVASGVCDLTVAYAKERRQFGRPIGSFQAVKHALADMLVRAEMARVQAYAAAAHLDEAELADVERAVAAAKIVAGDAAYENGKAAIQLHGGMGMTWEVDAHLYLKRAHALDAVFGSADAHAEAIAARVG